MLVNCFKEAASFAIKISIASQGFGAHPKFSHQDLHVHPFSIFFSQGRPQSDWKIDTKNCRV
jgi:hypothetical protein